LALCTPSGAQHKKEEKSMSFAIKIQPIVCLALAVMLATFGLTVKKRNSPVITNLNDINP